MAATAPLGADVLERLARRHEIAYLLTRPDKPRGRRRRVARSPAKVVAERLGIDVRDPERLDATFGADADTVVVVAYGQLVPADLLARARWLNVHPSLLPRWRGAAPVERALMAGDAETGVSIIELVEELDAGPIAAQERFGIGPDDDAGSVFARAAELTPDLVDGALGNEAPSPQSGHAVEQLGRRPVRKLDGPVQAALRLGAYELGFMETPQHAAVNEAVELVRVAKLDRAVAFTNAVMRRLADGIGPLLETLPDGPLKESYPDWIADVWARDLGREEALALMQAQNEPPETVVRLVRGEGEGASTDIPGAYRVDRVDEHALAEGRIWPQSRASQLAGIVVGSVEGERVLDLCAAPGGKATQLAGEVTAVEKHPGRARELEENAARLGATNVSVVCADALRLPPELRDYDHVLVDAPCSGLGVLAARPDLRWRAEPLPELQRDLLRVAAERVKPGGTIVYSVCTINAAENEDVVDASGLEPEPLGNGWPRFRHPRRPEFLLTLPHVHGTSGFFVARLRRP